MLADTLRMVVLAVLVVGIVTGRVGVAVVLAAMFLLGTAETVADTTSTTLLPMLVAKPDLGIANARLGAGLIVGNQLAGPPIGAALFVAGAAWPFVAQAVLLALGVLLISRIVLPTTPRQAPAAPRRVRADIADGVRWLWSHPPVRTLALTIVTFNVTFGAAWSVLVLYAGQRLGLGEIGFGLITTAGAVGGLLGSAGYGRLERRFSLATIMKAGLVIETLTHLALAVTTTAWLALIVFAVFGAHASIWGTTSSSVRQRAVPVGVPGPGEQRLPDGHDRRSGRRVRARRRHRAGLGGDRPVLVRVRRLGGAAGADLAAAGPHRARRGRFRRSAGLSAGLPAGLRLSRQGSVPKNAQRIETSGIETSGIEPSGIEPSAGRHPVSTTETNRPTHPPFDPELVPALTVIAEMIPPFTLEGIPAARAAMAEGLPGVPPFDLTMGGKVRVEERVAPGPAGAPDITLLVLTPTEGTGPWPALYHTHGGGMIIGTKEMGAELLAQLAAEIGVVGVSVEYRLAPEHPDPAPVEDCYAGLVWTAEHADELGIDRDRIVIIGTSAGGGLAAGTALLARDRGFPALSHQVLICPMLDDRFVTPSSQELDGEGVWDRNANEVGWTALLGERRGGPDVSPYAAPARAIDLSGLPRTYLDCGSVETFRDEAIHYAQRLSQAGVSVDLHIWGGGFHGFDIMVPDAAISRASVTTRHDFLVRALTRT